jgi:hypothetical protein
MSTNPPTAIAPAIELSPVEGAPNSLPEQDTKSATGAADIETGAGAKGAGIRNMHQHQTPDYWNSGARRASKALQR